jgi:hypothetical protein
VIAAKSTLLASVLGIVVCCAAPLAAQDPNSPVPSLPPEPPRLHPVTVPAADDPSKLVGEQDSVATDPVFGGTTATGCEVCCGGCSTPPPWYVETGIVLMNRNRDSEVQLSYSFIPNRFAATTIPENVNFPGLNQVFVTANETPTAEVLNTHSAQMDVTPGMWVTLGHYLGRDSENRDHYFEMGYWALLRNTSSKEVTGQNTSFYDQRVSYPINQAGAAGFVPTFVQEQFGNLLSQFPLVHFIDVTRGTFTPQQLALSLGFNEALQQSYSFRTDMQSMEMNVLSEFQGEPDRLVFQPNTGRWRRQCTPGATCGYFFGLRWLFLEEEFQYQSFGHRFKYDDLGLGEEHFGINTSGRYAIRTHNDMIGFQMGGNLTYHFCKWAFDVHGKCGPYLNFADQTSLLQANPGIDHVPDAKVPTPLDPIEEATSARRMVASVEGEFGFTATYKWRPNVILRASYDFMWLGNLALAPEQIQWAVNPQPRISTSGIVTLNGLTTGLEFNW